MVYTKLGFLISIFIISVLKSESKCHRGCNLALASYYVNEGLVLSYISRLFNQSNYDYILSFNPEVLDKDRIQKDSKLNIPFRCDCIGGEFLGHVFSYSLVPADTYEKIAGKYYVNLTTAKWLNEFGNSYDPNRLPDRDGQVNVTINCSCGDRSVSMAYGLFVTYPLRIGDSLASVAKEFGVSSQLLQDYNPYSNFSAESGLVFIPGKGSGYPSDT